MEMVSSEVNQPEGQPIVAAESVEEKEKEAEKAPEVQGAQQQSKRKQRKLRNGANRIRQYDVGYSEERPVILRGFPGKGTFELSAGGTGRYRIDIADVDPKALYFAFVELQHEAKVSSAPPLVTCMQAELAENQTNRVLSLNEHRTGSLTQKIHFPPPVVDAFAEVNGTGTPVHAPDAARMLTDWFGKNLEVRETPAVRQEVAPKGPSKRRIYELARDMLDGK